MDEKYKAIPTIKQLNLSASPKSVSFDSVKSSFSTKSKEDKFNKAYANDFSGSSSSGSSEAGAKMKNPKTPLLLKPQKLPPLEGKVLNPLTGRMIAANGSVHKKLLKEGKMSKDTSPMGAKSGKIDFFSPPPETLLEPPSISFPEPEKRQEYTIEKGASGGIVIYDGGYMSDPADMTLDWYLSMNQNTPTDPKYGKQKIKLLKEELEDGDRYGQIYDTYADPKRLLKAKPLIDERLRRWVGRKDPDVPAKYSDGESDNDVWYTHQKYFDSSSSSEAVPNMKKYIEVMKQYSPKTDITAKKPPAKMIEAEAKMKKKYMEIRKQFSPKTDVTTKNPPAKIMNPVKKNSPPATTPPKKKRGRPKGSLNKPKPKPKSKSKSSSSSSSSGYNQSSPQFV